MAPAASVVVAFRSLGSAGLGVARASPHRVSDLGSSGSQWRCVWQLELQEDEESLGLSLHPVSCAARFTDQELLVGLG